MYAIVKLAGKQFKVEKGDKIVVDRLDQEEGKAFTVSDILLVGNESDIKVGGPLVEKASVKFKVLEHSKGDKIRVAKYKAKSRYRKVMGHRQHQTVLEVTAINA